jgi:hypothetical protein
MVLWHGVHISKRAAARCAFGRTAQTHLGKRGLKRSPPLHPRLVVPVRDRPLTKTIRHIVIGLLATSGR